MEEQNSTTRTLREYLPEPGVDSRVELFVKTLAPVENYEAQDRLVSALTALDERDALGEFSITVWGDRICTDGELSTIDSGKHIVETIGDFYAFAAEEGINVARFFTNKTVDASLSGESFTCIVPPNQCTAMFQGDRLVGVFPCVIDGEVYNVRDAVEQFEQVCLEASPETATPE